MFRSLLLALTLALASTFVATAQVAADSSEVETWKVDFDAEIGLLSFENAEGNKETYFSSVLLPTFSKGPWAIGGRVRFRLNGGGFRKEDYNSLADILAMARFVQYGDRPQSEEAGHDLYGRAGELEAVSLGYGQIIGAYRNTISADNPSIGVAGTRGYESIVVSAMYSSITKPGVFGVRGALWPYQTREGFRFQNVVFGATLAGDLNTDGRLTNPDAPGVPYVGEGETGNPLIGVGQGTSDGVLVIASVDAGMPLQVPNVDELLVYTELAKIAGFGSGLSLGLNGTKRRGDIRMEAWFEQRLSGKQYLPNYFNSLYEVERLQGTTVDLGTGETVPAFQTKRNRLAGQDHTLFGSFVAFEASVRRRYRTRISLERTWNQPNSDWFHIDIGLYDPELPIHLRFMFDRINMDQLEDIWNGPSDNGIMRLDLAYQFWEHLLVGFRFRQSFEPVERLGRVVGQKKQTRLEPNFVVRL